MDCLASLLFFIITTMLFPLGLSPSPELLARIAPAVIWVCALLAMLLPLERLFGSDVDDGTLDQWLLSGLSPIGLAAAKALSHWLITGVPLLIVSLPVAIMLGLPSSSIFVLLLGLLIGTHVLSLLGTVAAAIVIGARYPAMLLPLLVLPLAIPVLIFGTLGLDAVSIGQSARPDLLLLAAYWAIAVPFYPLIAGMALRSAVA